MVKRIDITQLRPLGDEFNREIQKVKDNVEGLEVKIYVAPNDINYAVPSPIVEYRSSLTYQREYGNDGLGLIKDVCSGRIQ